MTTTLLPDDDLESLAAAAPDWTLSQDRRSISRACTFAAFPQGIAFVNTVAKLAEAMNHHPDIDIRWTMVRCALSTHSAGGLTQLDFDLAKQIDNAFDEACA